MKRQSKMFGKVYLHFRYGSWHDQWRRGVASSIKHGSEVLTRPVFDGAMFGVCVCGCLLMWLSSLAAKKNLGLELQS